MPSKHHVAGQHRFVDHLLHLLTNILGPQTCTADEDKIDVLIRTNFLGSFLKFNFALKTIFNLNGVWAVLENDSETPDEHVLETTEN